MTATSLRQRTSVRPEIQALRAIAIVAVMVNHVVPRFAPAGYIGVDVFFVVSGYLITGLLLREHARTGRIDFRAFYLRRLRRLLPAALVALTVCTVITVTFVPRRMWPEFLGEIAASLLYVQNWFMALGTIDPVRSQLGSTPVVHFWSLSLEEQFYLVWPWLILLALVVARVLGRSGLRTVPILAGVLLLVTVPSFVYCGLKTDAAADWAYYSTFSRAWEFGAGGLMALLPLTPRFFTPRQRAVVSWLGFALIAGVALFWNHPAAFPGWIAVVPVLGTMAVLVAGAPELPWSTLRLARLRPVQWIGDASYSLYLWHLPVVGFTPYITGQASPWYVVAGLVALTFVVAALSLRYVENPIRFRAPELRRREPAVVAALASLAALTLVLSFWGIHAVTVAPA